MRTNTSFLLELANRGVCDAQARNGTSRRASKGQKPTREEWSVLAFDIMPKRPYQGTSKSCRILCLLCCALLFQLGWVLKVVWPHVCSKRTSKRTEANWRFIPSQIYPKKETGRASPSTAVLVHSFIQSFTPTYVSSQRLKHRYCRAHGQWPDSNFTDLLRSMSRFGNNRTLAVPWPWV